MPDENGPPTPTKRPKKGSGRRSYASEFADLQRWQTATNARIDFAVRLLKKSTESEANSPAAKELVAVAIETLEGE